MIVEAIEQLSQTLRGNFGVNVVTSFQLCAIVWLNDNGGGLSYCHPGMYGNFLWDSAEGHLKGFRGSPQFQTFFEAVRPFFSAIM